MMFYMLLRISAHCMNVFFTVAPDLYAVFIDIGHYIFPLNRYEALAMLFSAMSVFHRIG